jgi:hypothetical protein
LGLLMYADNSPSGGYRPLVDRAMGVSVHMGSFIPQSI